MFDLKDILMKNPRNVFVVFFFFFQLHIFFKLISSEIQSSEQCLYCGFIVSQSIMLTADLDFFYFFFKCR